MQPLIFMIVLNSSLLALYPSSQADFFFTGGFIGESCFFHRRLLLQYMYNRRWEPPKLANRLFDRCSTHRSYQLVPKRSDAPSRWSCKLEIATRERTTERGMVDDVDEHNEHTQTRTRWLGKIGLEIKFETSDLQARKSFCSVLSN